MSRASHIAFWVIAIVALSIYVVMVSWTLPTISAAARNLPAFDLRPLGYSFDDAKAFLTALSPEGRQLYRNTQLWLDTFYPPLFAIFIAMSLWIATPKSLESLRKFFPVLGVPVALFDLLENGLVAKMLDTAPEALGRDIVYSASQMTMLKTLFTSVALTILVIFVGLLAWHRWKKT